MVGVGVAVAPPLLVVFVVSVTARAIQENRRSIAAVLDILILNPLVFTSATAYVGKLLISTTPAI